MRNFDSVTRDFSRKSDNVFGQSGRTTPKNSEYYPSGREVRRTLTFGTLTSQGCSFVTRFSLFIFFNNFQKNIKNIRCIYHIFVEQTKSFRQPRLATRIHLYSLTSLCNSSKLRISASEHLYQEIEKYLGSKSKYLPRRRGAGFFFCLFFFVFVSGVVLGPIHDEAGQFQRLRFFRGAIYPSDTSGYIQKRAH